MNNISNCNVSVNFGAKKLGSTPIVWAKKHGILAPKDFQIVEINPENYSDLRTLYSLNKNWKKDMKRLDIESSHYLDDIFNFALIKADNASSGSKKSTTRFFALTKQRFFLNYLFPQKVVAVAQMHINFNQYQVLDFIQVKPKYQYANKNRRIKDIGKQFLNLLANLTPDKNFKLISNCSAEGFYQKCGAHPDELWNGRYTVYG